MMMSKNTNISIQIVDGEVKPSVISGTKRDIVFAFMMIFNGMVREGILDKNDLDFIANHAALSHEEVMTKCLEITGSIGGLLEALDNIRKLKEEASKKAPEDVAKDFDELLKGFFQNLREEKDK